MQKIGGINGTGGGGGDDGDGEIFPTLIYVHKISFILMSIVGYRAFSAITQ